jgi:hypothetical protein
VANYVTSYNGQRVEITQERLAQFLADNPNDIGRVGSAFYNDSDNLALQHSPSVPTPSVPTPAPQYVTRVIADVGYAGGNMAVPQPDMPLRVAVPTPIAGPAGLITTSSPADGMLTGSGNTPPPLSLVKGNSTGGGPISIASNFNLPSLPSWVWLAAAAAIVLMLVKKR